MLLEVLSLAPAVAPHSFALLAFMCVVSYLLRTVALIEAPLSRVVHATACVLTLLPAFVLAAVLWFAASRHPDRAWINLGLAAGVYVFWWAGGAITRAARVDTEGGDIGWLTMGACVTFPVGLIAALVYR